jgi:hypothetical protein
MDGRGVGDAKDEKAKANSLKQSLSTKRSSHWNYLHGLTSISTPTIAIATILPNFFL